MTNHSPIDFVGFNQSILLQHVAYRRFGEKIGVKFVFLPPSPFHERQFIFLLNFLLVSVREPTERRSVLPTDSFPVEMRSITEDFERSHLDTANFATEAKPPGIYEVRAEAFVVHNHTVWSLR